jgi:hypothetical protein
MTNKEKARGKPKKAPKAAAPPKKLAKTKGDQREPAPENTRFTTAKELAESTLDELYGEGGPRTGPGDVTADLRSDGGELHRLAVLVTKALGRLHHTDAGSEEDDAFGQALDRLQKRMADSRRLAERVEQTKRTAATVGDGIDLGADPLTAETWKLVQRERTARDPESPFDTDRATKVTNVLTAIETRLGVIDAILTAVNGRPNATRVGKIPDELVKAMGITRKAQDITDLLGTLRDCAVLEPDPTVLLDLLTNTDSPINLPLLLKPAQAVGANLLDVLKECRPEGKSVGEHSLAWDLLAMVADSGQDIDYFLTGDGGHLLFHLRSAAKYEAKLWGGQTILAAELRCGPPNGPLVTFEQIQAIADLAGGGVGLGGHRYMGGSAYGNISAKDCVLLPEWDHGNTSRIHYTEYDIRPFTQLHLRGAERVVVGTDGRKYYTDDHYKTFKRIT